MSLNLDAIPIIDHHAHALLRTPPATPQEWQGFFTESTEPELVERHGAHLLAFRYAVKALARLLGCEPDPALVLARRDALGLPAWTDLLVRDANLDTLLIDYGFRSLRNYGPQEMAALFPCRLGSILRLETLAQELILGSDTLDQFLDAYRAALQAAPDQGYVAFKSIIAYRTGLAIEPWAQEDLRSAFAGIKEQARREGSVRLASKPLNDALVLHALEVAERLRFPVQFHTGFGDTDQDMLLSNPLHFRPLLQSGKYRHVPWVILHMGYPYARQSSYLASVYANVYVDLSLAIPFAPSDVSALLTELMGLAPLSKLLYASDGFSIPEHFWLGARMVRRHLGRALEQLIADEVLDAREAEEAAHLILHRNARQVYGLGG